MVVPDIDLRQQRVWW